MDPVDDLGALSPGVVRGPFHGRQAERGATFYEDAGWLWTATFGDTLEEYWAVRRDAGIWDVSALIKWRFAGPQALDAVDRLFTRDVHGATPGSVRYGAVLDERGRILDEGTAYVVSPELAYLMLNDESSSEHIRRHAAELDVTIENVSRRMPNVQVQGPGSFTALSQLTDADIASLGYFTCTVEPIELAGVPGMLSRTGYSGELGYEFFLEDQDGAEQVWDALVDRGVRPFGLDAADLLRVEAGFLMYEVDYVPGKTNPYDVSLDRFVDLDKPDFVGKSALLEVGADPPRRYKTLSIEGDTEPEPETPVLDVDAVVGEVRSPARTPRFGVIALVELDRGVAREGYALKVEGRRAVVESLPIDDPSRRRPRSDPRDPIRVANGESSRI